jgi:hypothetical protein
MVRPIARAGGFGSTYVYVTKEPAPITVPNNPMAAREQRGVWSWRAAAATVTSFAILSLAANPLAQTRGPVSRAQRQITVNGGPLDAGGWRVLEQLEALGGGQRLPDGHYWYDAMAGVAGRWGGPAAVLLMPGLPLGGRMPPQASGGGDGRLTGIFVNGRELHPGDVRALIAIYGQAWPGRWWVNGVGDFGPEGGFAIGNLRRAAAAARGGPWLRGGGAGSNSFWAGGDGNGYVWAMDGYSGCSYASDGGGVIC